jgi:hypothetical protein
MTKPTIHGRHRTISASMLLDTLGESLAAIKDEDRATDDDLGAVLGKSDDQAAKYRVGLAEMGVVAFLRGCEKWDGRFANGVLNKLGMKLVPLDAGQADAHTSVSSLMKAVLSLHEAAADDGVFDDVELAQRRSLIEDAGKVLDGLRERLTLKAVA